jgi:hypothetical protein
VSFQCWQRFTQEASLEGVGGDGVYSILQEQRLWLGRKLSGRGFLEQWEMGSKEVRPGKAIRVELVAESGG